MSFNSFLVLLQGIINLSLGLRPSRLENMSSGRILPSFQRNMLKRLLTATNLSGITSQNPAPSEDLSWILFMITFSERDFCQHYGSSDFYFDRQNRRPHWTLLRVCHPLLASHETDSSSVLCVQTDRVCMNVDSTHVTHSTLWIHSAI